MRKTIFILNFIFSTLIFAQNPESSTLFEKEYYDLVTYIPENLKSDSIHQLESPLFKGSLNTIGSLKLYNGFRQDFNLSENDIKWLENRIGQMATELFIDGKRILISAVGGYSGCPEKMIDTIKLNNIKITNLKFCHSCTDSYRDENFIEKFNNKMYSLMGIEPPNRKTHRFYGKFIGYGKNNNGIELVLTDDRTFKFWKRKGHSSDFTEGLWKNRNDTLILNSKTLTKNDSLTYALSSAKWVEFNDLVFRLKKEKLTELNNGKQKLKKITE
ncbi:hypothetical protein [Algibacter lectus]|uniref:Uncharacterized protein n=1 Tax=Algibacter lectus TaxID=221126 RepID=A0A4R8MLP2_9FLAO|nr:hypothetical protein [Algibacter lectus]MWW26807.1 hypothetical protein [Algibacter lectus]TDY65352.1 hypothetical protein DFQ06_0172 [Algibacter lectus]